MFGCSGFFFFCFFVFFSDSERLYETIFQSLSSRIPKRGRKKRDMIEERKCINSPHPHLLQSTEGPCYTIIQISKTPQYNTQHYHPTTTLPPLLYPRPRPLIRRTRPDKMKRNRKNLNVLTLTSYSRSPSQIDPPGRVAQSVGYLTRKSGVLGSIPGLATYFRFSFRFF